MCYCASAAPQRLASVRGLECTLKFHSKSPCLLVNVQLVDVNYRSLCRFKPSCQSADQSEKYLQPSALSFSEHTAITVITNSERMFNWPGYDHCKQLPSQSDICLAVNVGLASLLCMLLWYLWTGCVMVIVTDVVSKWQCSLCCHRGAATARVHPVHLMSVDQRQPQISMSRQL